MPSTTVKERVGHELREYAITAGYLFVWLSALILYGNAVQGETGLAALPFGVAAAKALVLGKFVLLGHALGAGTRVAAPTLVHRIAWRSISVLVVVIALKVVEEAVVGVVHGRSLGEALAGLTNRPLETAAGVLLMLLVLIPFVAAKQVSLALGPGGLTGLLGSRREG